MRNYVLGKYAVKAAWLFFVFGLIVLKFLDNSFMSWDVVIGLAFLGWVVAC